MDSGKAKNGASLGKRPSRDGFFALEVILLVAVPTALLLFAFMDFEQSGILTIGVAVIALVIFFVGYEKSSPGLRQIVPTAVMAAISCAGRILFA
ncbi:MAG: hypothetical protein LUB61_01965, partial [Eggerthellaceae bacterium]|nr:hypothetical protein [Eggerthellaceae bacterium]